MSDVANVEHSHAACDVQGAVDDVGVVDVDCVGDAAADGGRLYVLYVLDAAVDGGRVADVLLLQAAADAAVDVRRVTDVACKCTQAAGVSVCA